MSKNDEWEKLKQLNRASSGSPSPGQSSSGQPSYSTYHGAPRSDFPPKKLRLTGIGFTLLLYAVCGHLLGILFMVLFYSYGREAVDEIAGSIYWTIWLASSGAMFLAVVIICYARGTIVSAILSVVGLVIPCVNLFVVLYFYLDTKQFLESYSVQINFMGVNFDSIPHG